jgi:hypothetical protein
MKTHKVIRKTISKLPTRVIMWEPQTQFLENKQVFIIFINYKPPFKTSW